jgi:phosphoribosyl-AMP cyclohydrolase
MTAKTKRAKPQQRYKTLMSVLQFNGQGLIPAVIQDEASQQVLTLCYLNRKALEKSLTTGTVYVFRRLQNRLMQKGQTSGHIQRIRQVLVDCEGKSLVFRVDQHVAACHAGYFTCYFRRLKDGRLVAVGRKVFDPARVYRR